MTQEAASSTPPWLRSDLVTNEDWAHAYADYGWPVFPCHWPVSGGCSCGKDCGRDRGKHPKTKNGVLDATLDHATIRLWWSRSPSANVGIATSATCSVLDIDPDKDGLASLAALEARHWAVPDTPRSLTGGGGEHRVFTGDMHRNTASQLGPGLDTRCSGGYIIAPPSLHLSGNRYRWDVASPDSMAATPDWLVPRQRTGDGPVDGPMPEFKTPMDERVKRAKAYILSVPGVIDGNGGSHNATLRLAVHLVRGFALGELMGFKLMEEWSRKCVPPWSYKEILHKVQDADRVGEMEWGAQLREEKVDAGTHTEEEPSVFNACYHESTASWLSEVLPPRQWVLRDMRANGNGLIPSGKVSQLVADGGVGKTMLLIQLAYAVATGTTFLDTFRVEKPGPVLMLLGEEDLQTFKERLQRAFVLGGRVPIPEGFICPVALDGQPSAMLMSDDRRNQIATKFFHDAMARSTKKPWALITMDPLTQFAGSEVEKDNAQATAFVNMFSGLVRSSGAAAIQSVHTPKSSNGKTATMDDVMGRGSSALRSAVRAELKLMRERVSCGGDPEAKRRFRFLVHLAFGKNNYGPEADPLVLRYGDLGELLLCDEADMAFISELKAAADPKAARAVEAERVRAARQVAEEVERVNRAAAREAATSARATLEDSTLCAIVVASPGCSERHILTSMRASLGSCSDSASRLAVIRCQRSGVITISADGQNRTTRHYVVGK